MAANLPAGWKIESVPVLGARSRASEENFGIGRKSQIRGVRLPMSDEWAVAVANELGDIRVYSGLPGGEAQDIPLLAPSNKDPASLSTIGWAATGMPGQFRYFAVLPRAGGKSWDLLYSHYWAGKVQFHRKLDETGELTFSAPEPVMDHYGVPEFVDWRRDGSHDLLMAEADGRLVRFERDASQPGKIAFKPISSPVIAGVAPIELTAPIFPCVVDWDGTGKSDLLIGTSDGSVLIFRDVGDGKQVSYARGRKLRNNGGFIKVDGPACPTIITQKGKRFLLVADGNGVIWSWPIQQAKSYVTTDLRAAFGGDASGISQGWRKGAWWIRTGPEGALLSAAPEPPVPAAPRGQTTVFDPVAPVLRLKPPVAGPCEIHVTLRHPAGVPQQPMLDIRLDNDANWTILNLSEAHLGPRQEVFFKAADVTGREICFRQLVCALSLEGGYPVYIESIRLLPTPLRKARAARKHIPVAGIADAPDWFGSFRTDSPEEIDEIVGRHQGAGLDTIYYKLGGGTWEYPSRIPDARGVVPDLPTMSEKDKAYCARRIVLQEKVNRVQLTVEGCHRRGMKCIGWMRVQNHGERIAGKGPLDRFYVEHPQFLDKGQDGKPAEGKLCLGFPEVRAFHVALIEEAMDMGCDGILMDTMRHLPKVMWGDPVVEEFRKRHGLDMRKLPPFDERVMQLQIDIFTLFLREVREAMRKKNPAVPLHVRVCRPYRLMGCDPAAWAREGIVDEIIIEDRREAKAPEIAGLVAAVKGTKCTAGAVFCRPHWGLEKLALDPLRIESEAAKWLKAGARSLSFYETAEIYNRVEFSRAIRRLNDPGEMPSRMF